jgi:hypothetical protein
MVILGYSNLVSLFSIILNYFTLGYLKPFLNILS